MRGVASGRDPVLPDLVRPGLRIVFCDERATAADNLRHLDIEKTLAILDVSPYVS